MAQAKSPSLPRKRSPSTNLSSATRMSVRSKAAFQLNRSPTASPAAASCKASASAPSSTNPALRPANTAFRPGGRRYWALMLLVRERKNSPKTRPSPTSSKRTASLRSIASPKIPSARPCIPSTSSALSLPSGDRAGRRGYRRCIRRLARRRAATAETDRCQSETSRALCRAPISLEQLMAFTVSPTTKAANSRYGRLSARAGTRVRRDLPSSR